MTAAARSLGWAALAFLATAIGTSSLRYLLGDVDLAPPELRANMAARTAWFVAHAAASALALLILPWQLSRRVRRHRRLHRVLGRVYAAAVLTGSVAAVPIALGSWAGPVAAAGFLALAAAWVSTTAAGVWEARCGRVQAHRCWMIRSAALTCAALTLRLYLPVPELLGVEYIDGYRVIAWLCWLPNLAAAEVWARRHHHRSGTSAVGNSAAAAQ